MGIAILKKLNQITPDFAKRIASKYIRKKLICNRVFKAQYELLELSDEFTSDKILSYQTEQTQELLIHAYEHTDYYKELFDSIKFSPYGNFTLDSLNNIPKITKEDIINNFDKLQADNIFDYYEATTGGTSGNPLKVLLERDSIYKERAFVYHYWSKFGYDYKSSKVASFRGTDFNGKLFKYNPLYNEIQFNPCAINNTTIYKYIKKMDEYGVEFLHGFPSALYCFCQHVAKNNINLKKKYKAYFATSENLYSYQEELIEKVLGCKCIPFYGHTERNVFAEKYGDCYKFNPMYGVVKINKDDNSIICTGFLNKKMPLINYNVDDTIELKDKGYLIHGHRTGIIYGKNGELVSGASLEVHSHILDKVVNYQFEQNEIGNLKVYVVPFSELSIKEKDSVQNLFQSKVGKALDIELEIVNQLKYTGRGKTQLIIQNVKR